MRHNLRPGETFGEAAIRRAKEKLARLPASEADVVLRRQQRDREIEKQLRQLEDDKGDLPYAYMKAHGGDLLSADRAVAPAKKKINEAMKILRAERTRLKDEAKAARTTRAVARRVEVEADRFECQVCEGKFCVDQRGNMVHHGYQRPGFGYILGDCYAVGARPFPETYALVNYSIILHKQRTNVIDALNKDELTIREMFFSFYTRDPQTGKSGYRNVMKKETEVSPHDWNAQLGIRRANLKNELRSLEGEITRVDNRIAEGNRIRGER